MLAAVVSNDLTAEPLDVREVRTPEPPAGWVLVELRAASLNRLDAMMLESRTELPRPSVLGSDGAGVVRARGAGVQDVEIGSEVIINPSLSWGQAPEAPGADYEILGSPTDGTHAGHVVVPAENVHPKPGRLTWSEAAALPMAGLTAWRALVTRGRLTAGERVVVGAASSGVGSIAIQVAKALGAHVVAVTSTEAKAARARALGADEVVLRTNDDFAARLVEATGGRADLALDQTGALWQPLLQSLRPGGRLVVIGQMASAVGTARVQTVYWKQVDILGSSMGSPDDFACLLAHVESSSWAPLVDSEHPLRDIHAAYARLDAADRVGKVVLRMGPDA